jgi:exocyst complex component 6
LTSIILDDKVQEYIRQPQSSHANAYPYAAIKPKKLQALLEKLARYGAASRESAVREVGERRRKEAEAVGRMGS